VEISLSVNGLKAESRNTMQFFSFSGTLISVQDVSFNIEMNSGSQLTVTLNSPEVLPMFVRFTIRFEETAL